MTTSRKGAGSRPSIDLQELREQEVLRANRELAAYFKGRRTEREARAALKIVKAFIRERERIDPSRRRPLPSAATSTPKPKARRRRAKPARSVRQTSSIDKPVPKTDDGLDVASGPSKFGA